MGEAISGKFPVVIGVDFSEASAYAIQEGVQLARWMAHLELNFVHVMPAHPDMHDATLIAELSERMDRTTAKFESFVRDVMFVFGPLSGACDVAFHTRVGVPSRELHQVAVDTDAELIIVGSDHTRGLRRWFHRSALSELLDLAHVPVVIARPKDFRGLSRSPVPDAPRAGADLTQSGVTSYGHVDLTDVPRTPHMSGMI
jgi:nucleotide-binding universal stress UspA family protein